MKLETEPTTKSGELRCPTTNSQQNTATAHNFQNQQRKCAIAEAEGIDGGIARLAFLTLVTRQGVILRVPRLSDREIENKEATGSHQQQSTGPGSKLVSPH